MVDFVCYGQGDARTLDLYNFARVPAFFYGQTATSFKIAYSGNNVTEIQGYGFQYDPSTGAPIAGTSTYGLRSVGGDAYGLTTGISISMEKAAAYIAMNDPQAVNRDVFKGDDRITGSEFSDYLDGWAGADRMAGGAGNDTYIVDNVGDRIIEAKGGGTDKVLTSVSYKLAAGQEIESLQFTSSTSTAKLNLTGNEFGQSLVGNNGANVLDGGLGNDVLTGAKGADTFVFATKPGTGNVDRIVDFAAEDTIRLAKSVFAALAPGALAENAFKDLGVTGAKLDADDRIVYNHKTGVLAYDADGSGKGVAVTFATLDNKALLTHDDFFVV